METTSCKQALAMKKNFWEGKASVSFTRRNKMVNYMKDSTSTFDPFPVAVYGLTRQVAYFGIICGPSPENLLSVKVHQGGKYL